MVLMKVFALKHLQLYCELFAMANKRTYYTV